MNCVKFTHFDLPGLCPWTPLGEFSPPGYSCSKSNFLIPWLGGAGSQSAVDIKRDKMVLCPPLCYFRLSLHLMSVYAVTTDVCGWHWLFTAHLMLGKSKFLRQRRGQVVLCKLAVTTAIIALAIHMWQVQDLTTHHHVVALDKLPLSPSSINWYRPRRVISLTGKVTTVLVESNGSLLRSIDLLTDFATGYMTMSPAGWLPRDRDQLRAQRSHRIFIYYSL